jgi:tRNA (guanosine-2'-O-)-methyltransferase
MKKISTTLLETASPEERSGLLNYLDSYITGKRLEKFGEVLQNRTRFLTIVLEDIYQPHNASAVLRTCDCFGIQDVHIIENHNKYEVNPDVALGSSKWLTLKKYNRGENNTPSCLSELKNLGYRIIATTPHEHDDTPETLLLDEKTALVFGTELEGLTPDALAMADGFVRIPMFGFTESLNISVSAAVLIRSLVERLHREQPRWQLTEAERMEIRLDWAMNSVKHSKMLTDAYLKKIRSA